MKRKPNVYAVAARNMERRKRVEGGEVSVYPCFYICEAMGEPLS